MPVNSQMTSEIPKDTAPQVSPRRIVTAKIAVKAEVATDNDNNNAFLGFTLSAKYTSRNVQE